MRKSKQFKAKSKKANISLKRRWSLYYYRSILFLKIASVVFVCLFFFTDLFKGIKHRIGTNFHEISADYGFVLHNVVIEGQKNMPSKDIITALSADEGTPIFAINMDNVKDRLEDNIWVRRVIIERRLPSTIYIAVDERKPVAIWQFQHKLYLIDEEGNRISKHEGGGFEALLLVVGQDANLYTEILLEDLNRYPNLASKVNSSVRYGQRRWNLNFEQKITVKMPEEGFDKAYDYIKELDKNKKFFDQGYKMLDLRDSNKYYLEKN